MEESWNDTLAKHYSRKAAREAERARFDAQLAQQDVISQEPEMTPEMIDAGVTALVRCPGIAYGIEHFSLEDAVKLVYRAMRSAYHG